MTAENEMTIATPLAPARPVEGAIRVGVLAPTEDLSARKVEINVENLRISYGPKLAVRDVTIDIKQNSVTAFIGPSGCGKSPIPRCFDRMNDLIPGARVEGTITLAGEDIYGP